MASLGSGSLGGGSLDSGSLDSKNLDQIGQLLKLGITAVSFITALTSLS
ncbi:hypothetical protein ABH922_003601 [Rhodococcus sp. 27YEA15]